MSRYWSPVVHGLDPYVPGEQPKVDKLIKLNTNEHPYGPSPLAIEAIRAAASDALRLYPDPHADAIREPLAARFNLTPAHVFVGNGSDEVLAHVFLGLFRHERALWLPDVTYSFYPVYCGLYGIETRFVPLDSELGIVAEDFFPTEAHRAGGIIFANPNAPTGRLLGLAEVERIVAKNPQCVVVVDEAYIDFGGESAVTLVPRHPNLLVVQTFSKSRALAGLRVGYAIGHPDLIEGLDRVKNSFNSYPLDRLAIAGAAASLQDETFFRASCAQVIVQREALGDALHALGFEVLPSRANFVFARHPQHDAAALAAALRERAILVRHFAKPRIDQYLRITVGTPAQCAALLDALREIMATR